METEMAVAYIDVDVDPESPGTGPHSPGTVIKDLRPETVGVNNSLYLAPANDSGNHPGMKDFVSSPGAAPGMHSYVSLDHNEQKGEKDDTGRLSRMEGEGEISDHEEGTTKQKRRPKSTQQYRGTRNPVSNEDSHDESSSSDDQNELYGKRGFTKKNKTPVSPTDSDSSEAVGVTKRAPARKTSDELFKEASDKDFPGGTRDGRSSGMQGGTMF